MTTEINDGHPKLEIQARHYEQHLVPERLFHGGIWWTMTDCQSKGSFLCAVYRVSAYQSKGAL